MESFRVIGYYLCEVMDTPKWLHGAGSQVLSVSGCIGEQHPKWECFLGGWCRGESEEYQRTLGMGDGQYRQFLKAANDLFDRRRLDVDGRFFSLSDALEFHSRFCKNRPCRVVGLSTAPACLEMLAKELRGSHSYGWTSGGTAGGQWLGNDILGWDQSGFHSFLCNSLQEELPAARFNDRSLLENDFQEVVRFARQIEGLGEPVAWIPCRLGSYT